MSHGLLAVTQGGLAEDLADSATQEVALATARQCVNLLGAVAALGSLAWLLGLGQLAGLLAVAGGFILAVAATLRSASTIQPVRWMSALGLVCFPVLVAWTDAGVAIAALPWLIVLPLFGTIIDGRKMGLVFASLSSACIAVTVHALIVGAIPSTVPRRLALLLTCASLVTLVGVLVAVTSHYASARTATLERLASAERGLARAREQALLAERLTSLGTLAAGVAHEINNPMVFVAGNVESVLRQMKTARRNPELSLDLHGVRGRAGRRHERRNPCARNRGGPPDVRARARRVPPIRRRGQAGRRRLADRPQLP
jgi:signal transduction histidine kinase